MRSKLLLCLDLSTKSSGWSILNMTTNELVAYGRVEKYKEEEKRYNDIDYASRNNMLIIFTHEWQDFSTSIAKFTECCQFARDYGYIFEFPQNLI